MAKRSHRAYLKKKGDSKTPSKKRPITIISCLGKLFTSELNHRLTKYLDKYLEEYSVLKANQAGFRKGYSCSDHILTLHSFQILKCKKQNCTVHS